MAQFAVAVAPAPDSPSMDMKPDEPPANAEHKLAEVATFPSPSPAASNTQAPKLGEAPKAQRVVITPDGLITALQGRLQQAAEKAAQAAVAKQVDEALREALSSLNDVRESSVREIQELFPTRVEAMKLPRRRNSPARSPRTGKNKWKSTAARRRRWRSAWRNRRWSCGANWRDRRNLWNE